jgi:hypothetical protein
MGCDGQHPQLRGGPQLAGPWHGNCSSIAVSCDSLAPQATTEVIHDASRTHRENARHQTREMVNGPALKALIEEEFGDGIMSAIDFDLAIERMPDPKGDRVKLTMSGKFLPYKYYGATGNAQTYGYKED